MIPIEQIRRELFETDAHAAKVCASYEIPQDLRGEQLEQEMYRRLDQTPRGCTAALPTNQEVFKAAVLALASNMRAWAGVFAQMDALRDACFGYEPSQVTANADITLLALTKILRGQSGKRDRDSILAWALSLDHTTSFGEYLAALASRSRALLGNVVQISDPVLTASVAGIIGFDVKLQDHPAPSFGFPTKSPGMRGVLASEFLRNLGWSGFKPDRHIERLLAGWVKEERSWSGIDKHATDESRAILAALGVRNKAFERFLYFSRLGELSTPPGMPVTRADQVVWLYGSIVKRKPRGRRKRNNDQAP